MVRIAAKACRSCSAPDATASLSTCALSLARNRLAGCTRSPRSASTRVTGCWASQSICRSGWWARNASAIATSRRAWPSPIAEETNSARRRRLRAGVRVRRTGVGGARESANPATSRVNRTGSRSGMPVPRAGHGDEGAAGQVRHPDPRVARHDLVAVAVHHQHRARHGPAHRLRLGACRAGPGRPTSRRGSRRRSAAPSRPRPPAAWSSAARGTSARRTTRPIRGGPPARTGPPDPGNGPRRRPAALRLPCSTALRASWARPPPRRRPGRDERPRAAAHGGRPATTPRAQPARRRPRPWPRRRRRRTPRPRRPPGRSAGPRRRCPGPRRSPPGTAGPARAPAASTGACG